MHVCNNVITCMYACFSFLKLIKTIKTREHIYLKENFTTAAICFFLPPVYNFAIPELHHNFPPAFRFHWFMGTPILLENHWWSMLLNRVLVIQLYRVSKFYFLHVYIYTHTKLAL